MVIYFLLQIKKKIIFEMSYKRKVTIKDFRENLKKAIDNYKHNLQFLSQNPVEFEEIKEILGNDYREWIFFYKEYKRLNREKQIIFSKFPKLSYRQLLFIYSIYLEVVFEENTINIKSQLDVIKNLNFFLKRFEKNKITTVESSVIASELIPLISEVNRILQELENFQFMALLYADGDLNNKSKYSNILNQSSYKNYEKKMYIDSVCDNKNKVYDTFTDDDFIDLYLTCIKDKLDSDFQFLKIDLVKKEICSYLYVFKSFDNWEQVFPSELNIIAKNEDKKIVINNLFYFRRIKYDKLISELKIMYSKLKNFGLNFSDTYLEPFLVNLNSVDFNKDKLDYIFFRIDDYVYSNSRYLCPIKDLPFDDFLFSYFWKTSDIKEKKKFSNNFEGIVFNIFNEKKYGFIAKKNIEYKIHNKSYEIDLLAYDAKTIVIGEVKSTDDNYWFSSIKRNETNNLNGKAKNQLQRMKQHLDNIEILNQIGLTQEDLIKKEVVFMIISTTFDGVGQVEGCVSVNIFLLDLLLSEYIKNNNTINQIYKKILNKINYSATLEKEFKVILE